MGAKQTPPPSREVMRLCHFCDIPLRLAILTVTVCVVEGHDVRAVRANGRNLAGVRRKIALEARSKGYSYPQIGRALNRDHTTIIHAVRTAKVEAEAIGG